MNILSPFVTEGIVSTLDSSDVILSNFNLRQKINRK